LTIIKGIKGDLIDTSPIYIEFDCGIPTALYGHIMVRAHMKQPVSCCKSNRFSHLKVAAGLGRREEGISEEKDPS
jgi:hypothetical protein